LRCFRFGPERAANRRDEELATKEQPRSGDMS
jgi:hypothetical protein